MTGEDFGKIWRMIIALWPNASPGKSENVRRVWEYGLRPYSSEDVTERVIRYARQNKFFPDLADVTGGLREQEDPEKQREEIEHTKRMLAFFERRSADRGSCEEDRADPA